MVVGLTTTCAIGAYCPIKLLVRFPFMVRCMRYNIMCSVGTPVSSTNKTDHHYIIEILLKVALNTTKPTNHWNNQVQLTWATITINLYWFNFRLYQGSQNVPATVDFTGCFWLSAVYKFVKNKNRSW